MRHAAKFLPIGALLALLFSALTGRADAQTQPAENDAYRKVLNEALKEFDAGNWEEAKALMSQAHEIQPSARTFRGMGLCSYELRDYVSARHELRQSLSDQRRPLTAKQRAEIEEILARAERFVSRYRVHVQPEGAALRVDGNALQLETGGELLLNPGVHRLEAELEGYQPYVVELRSAGQSEGEGVRDLDIALVALGGVADASAAGAQEPNPPASAQPGRHRLWTWVAVGATGVFAATTIVVALLGQSAYDDVDKACPQNMCTSAEIDRRIDDSSIKTYQTLTNVGLALTAGAAVTATVLFFVEGKDTAPAETKLAVGAGTLQWTERF